MLKRARKYKRMSQKILAENLGLTQAYISRLENRNKYNINVTVDLIRKLSLELGLDPVDVFLYFYKQS